MINISKYTLLLCLTAALTGCKLIVTVGTGGHVQSLSGTKDCLENSVCEITVTDTNFSETFTATPKPGYEFVKWAAGTDFQCGDSANPVCTTSNTGFAGNTNAQAIVASDKSYYIEPLFQLSGPIAITECQSIVKPGSYVLLNDLNSIGDCIVLSVNNVSLDLQGFAISGNGTGDGVTIDRDGVSTLEGLAIRNGVITGFENGVDFTWVTNCVVENLRVLRNSGTGISTYDGCHISNNIATFNRTGIKADDGSAITGNIVRGNQGNGIQGAELGSIVQGNTVTANGGSGITGGPGISVVGNSIYSNGFGLYINCPSNIVNNAISANNTNLSESGSGCTYSQNLLP